MKPRMTLEDVCRDLRKNGFSINNQTLSDGIASGVYPFGDIISVSPTGRRNIQILRSDYESWKANVLFGKGRDFSALPPLTQKQAHQQPTSEDADLELLSAHTFTQENEDIVWEVVIRSWAKKK